MEKSNKKGIYVLYDQNQYYTGIVYCNNHTDEEESIEEIARAMTDFTYMGKFNSNDYSCVNSGGMKDDKNMVVMSDDGHLYVWQICSKVSDMTGAIVPNLYKVRKIGLIVNPKSEVIFNDTIKYRY